MEYLHILQRIARTSLCLQRNCAKGEQAEENKNP
jgi:hypothetical protein